MLTVALTKVYPDGNKSLTVTIVAELVPALFATMVKITLDPTFGVALFIVFTTFTSDCLIMTAFVETELQALIFLIITL